MDRITLFWCFGKKIFLDRMMEFQVKFCHHSGLRLWRTGMLLSTKSKGHKSNVRISWMYRFHFCDLKVHFWWPYKCLLSRISSLNTLYLHKIFIFDFTSYRVSHIEVFESKLSQFFSPVDACSGRLGIWVPSLSFHFINIIWHSQPRNPN